MKALIIGASGATGKDLVNILLEDNEYTQVTVFVRKTTAIVHPKFTEVITDFEKLENFSKFINGDMLFSCFGTTMKQAGSKNTQQHIDLEIPAQFADIAKRNGVQKMVLLSSYGAKSTSKVFYTRLKGLLEDHIDNLSFDQFITFRPGLLLRKNTDRFAEKISAGLLNLLNTFGLVKKFRPLPTNILATQMAKAPKIFPNGKHILELDQIFTL